MANEFVARNGLIAQNNSTVTGSLTVNGSTTVLGNTILSGSNNPGSLTSSVQIYGDIRQTGYHRFDPVSTNIDTSISASYIYVSGSTNDLYFSQNGEGYSNVTRLRWLESNLYTGLLHGGIISASIGGNIFTIKSGSGIIVNLNASTGSDPYPTTQFLTWPDLTSSIAPLSASYDQQFVAINSSAQIFAQGIPYTDGDYNTKIPIGVILHQNRSTINAAQTFPGVAYGWKQRSFDFIKAFGPLKISGYNLTPSSSLGLLLNGGIAFVDGRNYTVDPSNPSYIVEATGITTSKIYYYYQSGSDWKYNTNNGVGYSNITASLYSNSGSLTSVPTNDWTIQRVFYFPNSATKAFYIYFGNDHYATKDLAIANIATEPFNEAPNTAANAIFVGYMLLRYNADFTVAASYEFKAGGLFRGITGGGGGTSGGGGGATSLSGLTDVNILSPTNGQPLVYDSNSTKWINSSTLTASLYGTSSWASNSTSASYTATASYANNFTVANTLTAQTIVVQTITSSTDYVTGSSRFGSIISNTHQFTGSVSVSGSLAVNGNNVVTSNQTSSFVQNSQTSSFVTNSQTSSFVQNSQTSSFVTNSQTSSFVTNNKTGSFATTGSNSFKASQTITGSLVVSGSGATIELYGDKIIAGAIGGDEGGEILLGKPTTNSTLTGSGITIDSYQNKIRFFEQGGAARGAYIDISACSAGVGTNLLSGGGGTTFNGGTNVDNRIVTATGTSPELNGEANLTFNGSTLTVTGNVTASSFTGSLQGTSSWATNAITASSADAFIVRGNLTVSGSTTIGDATTDSITMNAATMSLGSGTGVLNIDSSTLYVDGNNNRVGIGTTTPSNKLEVNGIIGLPHVTLDGGTNAFGLQYFQTTAKSPSTGIAAAFNCNGTPTGYGYVFQFKANQAANSLLIVGDNTTTSHIFATDATPASTGWPLKFRVADTSGSWGTTEDLMTLTPDQKIGIGINSPTTRLHISSSDAKVVHIEGAYGYPIQILTTSQSLSAGYAAEIGSIGNGAGVLQLKTGSANEDWAPVSYEGSPLIEKTYTAIDLSAAGYTIPGPGVYEITVGSATYNLTFPDPTSFDGQKITIIDTDMSNSVIIDNTNTFAPYSQGSTTQITSFDYKSPISAVSLGGKWRNLLN